MVEAKDLYIIRHGETEYNRLGLVQGRSVDAELNQLGRLQALAFYQHFNHIPFDKIYVSQLKRTYQSVEPFIKDNIPYESLEGLNEISWGDREGRTITPEEDKAFHEMIEGWQRGELHRKLPGGESPLEVKARQEKALRYILAQKNERNVLICMHGRALRILICQFLNIDMSLMDTFPHQNLCLYHFRYENNSFCLLKENYTAHLDHLYRKENSILV